MTCRIKMKITTQLWRNSATLIVLAKNNTKNTNNYNYKILACKRSAALSYFPNSIVFAGGAASKSDESKEWLDYFKKFNISEKNLEQLSNVAGERPPIFQSDKDCFLKREISLRITAIREMFEELGVLVCCKKDKFQPAPGRYASYFEDFNREKWQKIVHNDPTKFLKLCQELDVIPDLWNLYEWSAWLTPTTFKLRNRFATAFFLVAFENTPNVIPEKTEVEDILLDYPHELVNSFLERKIVLFPPQLYEISRLKNIDNLDNVVEFCRNRQKLGTTLYFPVIYNCADGKLFVLPGDDLYPKNPNFVEDDHPIDQFAKDNLEEVRKKSKNIHRHEVRSVSNVQFYMNIMPPNGHIVPIMPYLRDSKL